MTTDEIDKKFDTLPEKIQNVIYSSTTTSIIKDLGEKYKLHIDKIEKLILAVEDVMTGDIKSSEFISHIAKELEIDQETANKIGAEIDQQIFEGVREAIKSLSAPTPSEPVSTNLPVVAETTTDIKPTIADIKTKEATSSPVQESNYSLDPYREPIE